MPNTGPYQVDFAKNPVLSKLPEAAMRGLLDRAESLQLPAGQFVVREGEPSESIFFVTRGDVAILKGEVEIDRQSAGGIVGEMGVLTGTPRNACVRCLTDVDLLRVSSSDFLEEVDRHPVVLRTMICDLVEKVKGTHGIRVEQSNRLDQARDIMLRCVSTEVLDRVFDHLSPVELLEGHLQAASILFFDIKGFSALAESMPPEKLLQALNVHLEVIIDTVAVHDGIIVNFIGDAVLAIFNCPIPVDHPSNKALSCCIECLRKVRSLHISRSSEGLVCFDVGAGLNCGTVVSGAIGSEKRFSYSVLGDEVNLAARLEELTRHYPLEIIFSAAFHGELTGPAAGQNLFFDRVKVRGRQSPLDLYTISNGIDGEKSAFVAARDLYLKGDFSQARSAFEAQSSALADYFARRCALLLEQTDVPWPGYFSWELK